MTEDTWKLLLTDVRSCTLCEAHLPKGPRPVVQFHPAARILVAGQAPGRKVHASGKPFDDASGDRLREWLGVTADTFYTPEQLAILPMGFCYPGTGKAGDLPPRPECAPTWRGKLLAELPNLELTIAIGRYAHDWHFPGSRLSVTDRVREWLDTEPAERSNVVPIPHPSPRNNRWLQRNPWFEAEVIPLLKDRVQRLLHGNPGSK